MMHADELPIDEPLVRGLVESQFSQFAALPLRRVASTGTDNTIYRLGDHLAVRLPRRPGAVGQARKDQQWLPRLAHALPLAIPEPVALGLPAEGYPWEWLVCRWLPGHSAVDAQFSDATQAARDLAAFVAALQSIDTTGGPPAGADNFYRGVPLAARDDGVRRGLAEVRDDEVDVVAMTPAWEAALATPPWTGPPVWLHGDLWASNLIVKEGRLSGVIDFGCLGVGDPACDLMPAWTVLDADTREVFRGALDVDDDMWARGRGWALTWIGAIPYYRDTNPTIVAAAKRGISEVLADHARGA